ncbi:T9SS type A sorting domain-containing protein, partial [Bacteroidota bacterium]
FTKNNFADWTLPENQDRITNDIWITRANERPIFNIAVDNLDQSPKDTRWAFGSIADGVENLSFDFWRETIEGSPPDMVNQDMVMYMVTDDIYVDIMFTSWTSGDEEVSPANTQWAFGSIANGVENLDFDYWRNTINGNPPGMVNQEMVMYMVSDDIYVDIMFTSWTNGHEVNSPADTRWAFGSITDGVENLNFDYWRNTVGGYPPGMVNQPMVMYMVTDDIYVDITFTSWQRGSESVSPAGTRWAWGSIADGVENLDFDYWLNTVGHYPPGMVDNNMVLFLVEDSIYIDITFTSWTGNNNGGGFTYERTTGDVSETLWTGPVTTFTKADYADWTMEVNQDRITENVWIARVDNKGIFNIVEEEEFTKGGGGFSYERSTGDISETLWTGTAMTFTKENFADWTLEENQDRITDNVWLTRADNRGIFNIFLEEEYGAGGGGGGFSYERSTGDISETLWTGTAMTFTKDNFADWTLEENQDRITDNVWITRADERGIFNIFLEEEYGAGGGGGGFSYERSTGNISETFWNGPSMTFVKENFADWTLEENQDRLTDNVWLTRANEKGIFNKAQEDSYDNFDGFGSTIIASPSDTRWAFGNIEDGVENLGFDSWAFTIDENPPEMVDEDMVLYLVTDDIYIDIKFTSWTSGEEEGGGGFSYERSTGSMSETLWTGPVITFTKENYADWTLAENQDRITDNVWITRADTRGIFNIAREDEYMITSTIPTNTKWAYGTTDGGIENLEFDYFLNTVDFEPPSMLDLPMVLKLEPDDIYIDIMFTSWAIGEVEYSPADTRWAWGSISDGVENLDFDVWRTTINSDPSSMVDNSMVLYLFTDDIYIDIMFTSWTGGNSGGGFSYERSTGDISETLWTGPTMSFTKADYADWTLDENQDRITDNVWITRADNQGLFNIAIEEGFLEGGGGFSYIRSSNPTTTREIVQDNKVKCYPNPATESITIKVNFDAENAIFELHDIYGKHLLSKNLTQASSNISINHIKSGIYIYTVKDKNKWYSGKLFIE